MAYRHECEYNSHHRRESERYGLLGNSIVLLVIQRSKLKLDDSKSLNIVINTMWFKL